ncbi:MAG: hypothetical protein QM527_11375 [Alphaproteobacteria bacterium]|nr:hypothetical protein [Alphaproteobacteria bacterium]
MNQHPNQSSAPVSEEEIEKMKNSVDYWENYIKDQQKKRLEAAEVIHNIMKESGLLERGINPADPVFAELSFDLEFQRQVSLHYGLKLNTAKEVDPSKPDVTRWRQRTNAIKV